MYPIQLHNIFFLEQYKNFHPYLYFENQFVKVLVSYFIHQHREVFGGTLHGNQYVLFDDIPLFWDAWDIMPYYRETRYHPFIGTFYALLVLTFRVRLFLCNGEVSQLKFLIHRKPLNESFNLSVVDEGPIRASFEVSKMKLSLFCQFDELAGTFQLPRHWYR